MVRNIYSLKLIYLYSYESAIIYNNILFAFFLLLLPKHRSQEDNMKLDTMSDGLVKGHFKNNVLAFSGEVVSGKMSGQWLFGLKKESLNLIAL